MWQKLSKCYQPRLELVPLLLLAFTVYLTLSNYVALPDTIPTHFDAQGMADGWGDKITIFYLLGLNVFIYILFTALNIALAMVRNPMVLVNLPAKWKVALSDSQIERLRVMLSRYLFSLKIVMQGLFTYILYITIQMAWERADNLGVLFYLLILAIVAIAGLILWQTLQLIRSPKMDLA